MYKNHKREHSLLHGFLATSLCFIVVSTEVYGMNVDVPYISAKALAFTKGYTYVKELRANNIHTIELPAQQFEAAYYADHLPIDLQHKIKADLGTGALRSLWAKSYAVRSRLQIPDYNAKEQVHMACSQEGLLAVAHTAITLWNPAQSKEPLAIFGFTHPLETPRFRYCLAFISEDMLAEGKSDEIRLWDIKKQMLKSKLSIPHMSGISHIIPSPKGLAFKARITFEPEDRGGFRPMVVTFKQLAIQWNLYDNAYDEVAYSVESLAAASDAKTFAVGTHNGILLCNKNEDEPFFTWGSHFSVDSVVFITPTLVAWSCSEKPSIMLYDIAKKEFLKGMAFGDYRVGHLARINDTTFVAYAVNVRSGNESEGKSHHVSMGLHILGTDGRAFLHCIEIPIHSPAFPPLVCGLGDTIALNNMNSEIIFYKPKTAMIPNDIDKIPCAAYALAAQEDDYEVIDDPDYCDDPDY